LKSIKSTQTTFYQSINKLLTISEIKQMDQFIQHGYTSCLEHCLAVAYYSYFIAQYFHLKVDEASLIRGSLLHDFFLYDWHDSSSKHRLHGFTHPTTALNNANKFFNLTAIEQDIIKHHMWPLTPIPPHTKEAYIVCFVDKWCSLRETFHCPLKIEIKK